MEDVIPGDALKRAFASDEWAAHRAVAEHLDFWVDYHFTSELGVGEAVNRFIPARDLRHDENSDAPIVLLIINDGGCCVEPIPTKPCHWTLCDCELGDILF